MERWRGRVAVVTGASSGIGAAIACQLQDAGVDVVGLARRENKIPEAVHAARKAAETRGRVQRGKAAAPGILHSVKCDIREESEIMDAFKWIKENTRGVDILVNNAGVSGTCNLSGPESNTEQWKNILEVNVLGLSICTREAIKQIRDRGSEDGHIVNICSVAGHVMPVPTWSMYFASKHAVRVLTEGLRKELVAAKSHIKVSEISPGLVHTEIFETTPDVNQEMLWNSPHLQPEDIADAVVYAISTPPHVQVHEIVIKPTGDSF